jgi:hypothetical protein
MKEKARKKTYFVKAIIVTNFPIEGIVGGHDIEELPPDELIDDGVARLRVALVHLQQRQTDYHTGVPQYQVISSSPPPSPIVVDPPKVMPSPGLQNTRIN